MTLLYELGNCQAGYRQVPRAQFLSCKPGAADVSPGLTLGGVKGSAGGGLSATVHTEPRGPWWRLWIRMIPDMLYFIVGIDT